MQIAKDVKLKGAAAAKGEDGGRLDAGEAAALVITHLQPSSFRPADLQSQHNQLLLINYRASLSN